MTAWRSTNQPDPAEDGYIECSECGHTLENDHDLEGCHGDGCDCTFALTRKAVRDLRAEYGMPRRWRRDRLAG